MTLGESTMLLVDLTRQLSAVQRERAMWRLLAVQGIEALREEQRRRAAVDARYESVVVEFRSFRERLMVRAEAA